MPKLTRVEIDAALEEYLQAEQIFNEAETDFVESATYRRKAAESRYNALIKQAKKDNIVKFPMVRCVPPEAEAEPEQSWPEFLFYLMKRPLEIAVGLLVFAFIIVQIGLWLGWFW